MENRKTKKMKVSKKRKSQKKISFDFFYFFFATGKPAGRPEFRYPVIYRTGRTGVNLQNHRTDRI